MQAAVSGTIARHERQGLAISGLDDLAALASTDLGELYARAEAPALSELDGDLRGRMLAVRGSGRIWFGLLRAFAAWRHFPWRGKSFWSGAHSERGDGINRVFGDGLAPATSRRWFRFETFIGPSRSDGAPAFQLDYDNQENPFFIRAIKDEVRRVGTGLFLGQAYLLWFGKPRLVLYFALSSRG